MVSNSSAHVVRLTKCDVTNVTNWFHIFGLFTPPKNKLQKNTTIVLDEHIFRSVDGFNFFFFWGKDWTTAVLNFIAASLTEFPRWAKISGKNACWWECNSPHVKSRYVSLFPGTQYKEYWPFRNRASSTQTSFLRALVSAIINLLFWKSHHSLSSRSLGTAWSAADVACGGANGMSSGPRCIFLKVS